MRINVDDIDRIIVGKHDSDYEKNFMLMSDMYRNYIEDLSHYTDTPMGECLIEPRDEDNYALITYKKMPVGFVIYNVFPEALTRHDVFIHEFYIKHDKRKQDIGKAFMSLMIKAAEYKDMDFSLAVYDNNHIAKRFWDKTFGMNGYIECFIRQNVYAHDGDNAELRWHYWTKRSESV
ncbi:MAG: GNAT family N-acetyltransferase [Eubacterium sp.]|nr:GNAT family N-acetyltransferase [Eubacterium sp.]